MKTFTFRYDPNASFKRMLNRLKTAASTGVPELREHEITSNSLDALYTSMSSGRIELFYAIAQHHPESMYRLAQLLNRDQANVLRDVKVLEGLGLIRLVPEMHGERERLRPIAKYDRIVFDFGAAVATA